MRAPLEIVADWIDVPSVSGSEGDYADVLALHLARVGLDVERQEVTPGRSNLLARPADGEPRVVFCTHQDTVPPWFGPTLERGLVRGRGACDAKGPALAMIQAVEALVRAGRRDVGLLFTVGEEQDSDGARLANRRLELPWRPAVTILGEPTDNRFVAGHKGVFKCSLVAHGVLGHSSQDVGPSAVHELVRVLDAVLGDEWGRDEFFGRGTVNVGTLQGGVAENVVADRAEARLMLRIVEEPERVEERLRRHLSDRVELLTQKAYGPLHFEVPDGEPDAPIVAFATDASHLPAWGRKMLYGPGSIQDAHTEHEKLSLASFERARAEYERTALLIFAKLDAEERA